MPVQISFSQQNSLSRRVHFDHIDGLRGIAIGLVMFYHIVVGKVSAGVDIFLFIGGLFVVSGQLSNAYKPSGMTIGQYIVRLIRRLLPVVVVVATCTTVAMFTSTPPAQWRAIAWDGSAAMSLWMNIRLIISGQSYAAAGMDVSPFQHMWSMSVQFQTYVVIAALCALWRYTSQPRHAATRTTALLCVLFSLLSLGWATYQTFQGNQATNYYSPLSRFWEIGLGGAAGLYIFSHPLPVVVRHICSVVGCILIGASGVMIDGAALYPSVWALIPITGALLVVWSGITRVGEQRTVWRMGATRLLEMAPMRALGKLSYSLYVWHWPVLIVGVHVLSSAPKDIGVGVVALSLALALATYRLVEVPCQQKEKPPRMSVLSKDFRELSFAKIHSVYALIAIGMICVIGVTIIALPWIFGVGSGWTRAQRIDAAMNVGGLDYAYPGAKAVTENAPVPYGMPVFPDPIDDESMLPQTQNDGCYTNSQDSRVVLTNNKGAPCRYGDVSSPDTLYAVGGSHVEHYIPALDRIGKQRGFAVVPFIKMGCQLGVPTAWDGSDNPSCDRQWTPRVIDYIMNNPPTMGVFLTSTRPVEPQGGAEHVPGYYVDIMTQFADNGIPVWAMRDNPWFLLREETGEFSRDDQGRLQAMDVRVCLSELDSSYCVMPLDGLWNATNPAAHVSHPLIRHMDVTFTIVKDNNAYPVVGNIMTMRDSHHYTRQWIESLTPEIDRQMFDVAPLPPGTAVPEPLPPVTSVPEPLPPGTSAPEPLPAQTPERIALSSL